MKNREKTITRALLSQARNNGGRMALADSSGAKVTFSEAITKAVFLTRRLEPIWKGQDRVGILVPPSVGGALLNWAAMLMGKVPVNLNYTLSAEGIVSCIEQCGLTDVVVSEKLMKKLKLDLPVRVHLLEELVKEPKLSEKIRAVFLAKFCSTKRLLRRLGGDQVTEDDLATIIFSSGSTGDPKTSDAWCRVKCEFFYVIDFVCCF